MIEVFSRVDIARSPHDVFDVIADMARNPEWQKGMRECTWTSAPPVAVGSTYDQVASFLGRRIVTSFEVVEFEPPRRIRIVSTASTFPLDIGRTVESIELADGAEGSRVAAVVKGDPGRLADLFGPLMRRMVRRSVRGDYQRLRSMLES